jgi:hypothetical protein
MVKITEKRTEKIQPTKIDNDLLFNVGEIMNEVCPPSFKVSFVINADSKDIESEDYKELKNLQIPVDTYFVHMAIDSESSSVPWKNPIDVSIDTKFPLKNSRIRLRGNDPTWVIGAALRLTEQFERKKLSYRHFARSEALRSVASFISSLLLMTALGLALLRLPIEPIYVFFTFIFLFYFFMALLKRFFDWLFPYFEIANDNFKPRKFRKLALSLLWGSGLLGIIIDMVLRYFRIA